uniref:Uncharacterized protein n=1 Tax=Rangifer tarandus platyrhynchus TaxID=3082113 RepID=A0ACB0EP24_RANTA|nr:unnamed protein product [Rangifer tarandus platyrhynchus]
MCGPADGLSAPFRSSLAARGPVPPLLLVGALTSSRGVLLPCPCCLRFGAQPPHSLSCCSNLSGPSAASVCASPTCAPGRCQRTLSGKACPIAEFPCPKCSVCRLSPTQKRPGLARADSLSPGSAGPPPGALHPALSSPVPCPSLCPPSGRAEALDWEPGGLRQQIRRGQVGRQTRVAACPPPSRKRRGAVPEVRRGLIRSENALIVNRSE